MAEKGVEEQVLAMERLRTRRAAFHDVIVQNAENKKLINQGIPCGIHSI